MIAHIAMLQDQLASANKTGKVANAEEMNSNPSLPDASLRASVHQKYLDTSKKEQ
jgi:hypothetical protein